MKSIKESIKEIKSQLGEPGSLGMAVRGTSTFKKFYSLNVGHFAQLSGSEKQIEWAKAIRLELAEKFAVQLCEYYYYKNAVEQRIESYNFYDGIDIDARVNAAVKILKTKNAASIIDNRHYSLL